jgi:hypothetical protein
MLGYKFKGLTAINRRRDRRIPITLPARVNGVPVLLRDVSLGGLSFISENARFELHDDVLIELDIIEFGCVKIGAVVVRARGNDEYGVTYVGLSSNAFKLIENLETRQVHRGARKVA